MPLWGGRQYQSTGNTKPNFSFAPYFAVPQGATLAAGAANNAQNVANVIGVTANGMANVSGVFLGRGGPAHAGWVSISVGRGFLAGATIFNQGNNVTNGTYSIIQGTSNLVGANVQVTSVSGNGAVGNVLSIAVRTAGDSINTANAQLINISFANSGGFGLNCYATGIIGGRAGRIMSETLVAMGSLVGSRDEANNWFVNNA